MRHQYSSLFAAAVMLGGSWLVAPMAQAADTAPPDPIEDLRVTGSTDSSLTLSWTAPGDDGMSGTVSSYDLRVAEYEILAGEEAVAPITGGEPDPMPGGETQTMVVKNLKPKTKYWFVMKTQDRSGNISTFSNIASGETQLDTSGPVIDKVKVADLTQTSGKITWITTEPATSELNYGETSSYGQLALASGLVTEHSLPVGGLQPDTTYHYKLKSVDQYGNATETVNMTFQTLATSTPTTTPSSPATATGQTKSETTAATAQGAPTITFSPRTMNLKSRVRWVTAVLKLPKGAREGLKFDTLRLNGTLKPAIAFAPTMQVVLNRYGTLWLKFSRAEIAGLIPPEVTEFTLTLTGATKAGEFSASQTLKVTNNITKAEWERLEALKKQAFEKDKAKRVSMLQKQIDALKKQLDALLQKLETVQAEQF